MNAARVMKETGCGAIKVEGGRRLAETIAFLAERGVPVMGHVGLTPQAINALGSFRAQGREEADWAPIEADAHAVADAGQLAQVNLTTGQATPVGAPPVTTDWNISLDANAAGQLFAGSHSGTFPLRQPEAAEGRP